MSTNRKIENIFEEALFCHLRKIAIFIIILSYMLPVGLVANQFVQSKKLDHHYKLSKLVR